MRHTSMLLPLILLTSGMLAAGEALKPGAGNVPPVVIEPFKPVELGQPDHVIGNGSPESVTEDALRKAFEKGGVIIFNTGGKPVTLKISQPLQLPVKAKPTIVDGMHLVTFDGDGKTRIFQKEWKTELTIQRAKFQHCRAEKEGGAIFNNNWDGRMTVIDCQFEDCKTTAKGPDIGGGAIRVTGQKNLIVSGCKFTDCAGSNGGAICTIGCQMTIVGCSFLNCRAFGEGGGADAGPTGQGGIGGAVYIDGVDQNADKKQLYVGDCLFRNNSAGAHAGAIFGYTRPDQNSVSVYYNSIFEGSSVDKVEGARGLHGGGIYSMYCNLYVMNCSFANNKTPSIGGAIFVAKMVSEQYANSEFYGNSPEFKGAGENISTARRDVPPAVAALGRMPGFQEKGGATQTARKSGAEFGPPSSAAATAAAPAAPAAKKDEAPAIDAKVIERWDAKLKENLAAALKAGKPVSTFLRLMGPKDAEAKYSVTATDDTSLTLSVQNNPMPVKWTQLSLREKAVLARAIALAQENVQTLVTAGMFLAFNDSLPEAEELFAKASATDAATVQAAKAALVAK